MHIRGYTFLFLDGVINHSIWGHKNTAEVLSGIYDPLFQRNDSTLRNLSLMVMRMSIKENIFPWTVQPRAVSLMDVCTPAE